MADTTRRVLQLLSLLQARRTWAGRELLDRLGVSERTLRRDIERLRRMGYRVRSATGPAGGYQLEPGPEMPPLLVDEEEAVAIAVGLLTAAGGSVAGIEETSVRALAKLEQLLPPRVRSRIDTLQSTVVPLIRPWVTVDPEVLSVLAQACRDRERVRFAYADRDGETSERHVEPHRLVALHQRWYLVAWDRDRDGWRTFRLDRVSAPWRTRLRFAPREVPGGDAAAYVLRSMRERPMRHRLVAILHADAAELSNRVRADDGTLEGIGAGRTLYRTQDDDLSWLAMRLLWLGVDFEVLEPPDLVAHLEDLAGRLRRAVPV